MKMKNIVRSKKIGAKEGITSPSKRSETAT